MHDPINSIMFNQDGTKLLTALDVIGEAPETHKSLVIWDIANLLKEVAKPQSSKKCDIQ